MAVPWQKPGCCAWKRSISREYCLEDGIPWQFPAAMGTSADILRVADIEIPVSSRSKGCQSPGAITISAPFDLPRQCHLAASVTGGTTSPECNTIACPHASEGRPRSSCLWYSRAPITSLTYRLQLGDLRRCLVSLGFRRIWGHERVGGDSVGSSAGAARILRPLPFGHNASARLVGALRAAADQSRALWLDLGSGPPARRTDTPPSPTRKT